VEESCGRWLLGRAIATGAWAEVRAARPADGAAHDLPATAAIKRQHAHAAREAAFDALFAAECALTASLPPHRALISAIVDDAPAPRSAAGPVAAVPPAAPPDRRPYLVMPLVDGPDLRARLVLGAIARPVWMSIVADVAAGLAHLHAHGWVHGDVNPSNILLGTGGAVLCDLGVARRSGAPGPVRGTAAYMAPEQVRGLPWSPAVDVFALGVVVWELAAGSRLFARPAPYLAMAAVVETTPPRLTGVEPALASLVAAMLAPVPADRPPAADVAASLAARR
jgi:serine/threonine protein kinase